MRTSIAFNHLFAAFIAVSFLCGTLSFSQEEGAQSKLKEIANRGSAAVESTKRITSPRYQRALALHQQHEQYLAEFAKGKTRPFPDIAENWATYQKATTNLAAKYEQFLAAEDSTQKQPLATELLDGLQLVGVVLRNASHGTIPEEVLTEQQVADQERLMQEYNTMASADQEDEVDLVTPDTIYTLKHLPIPIHFTGPKGTEIMLHSEVGGEFPNGYDYIKITTDENGVAQTFWISNGDGVANCQISFRSPALTGKGTLIAIVRELNLLPLTAFSPVAKAAAQQTKTISQ